MIFDDLLDVLSPERHAHCLAVGAKAALEAGRVPPAMRSDLVAAATLHDIGYGHVGLGFHPLDGARYLASLGFSRLVCHLVAEHSASRVEADLRGLDVELYAPFAVDTHPVAKQRLHAVLWWADLTTGPTGLDVTVESRLHEIEARYGPNDVVTRFIERARPILLTAGQSPAGSK